MPVKNALRTAFVVLFALPFLGASGTSDIPGIDPKSPAFLANFDGKQPPVTIVGFFSQHGDNNPAGGSIQYTANDGASNSTSLAVNLKPAAYHGAYYNLTSNEFRNWSNFKKVSFYVKGDLTGKNLRFRLRDANDEYWGMADGPAAGGISACPINAKFAEWTKITLDLSKFTNPGYGSKKAFDKKSIRGFHVQADNASTQTTFSIDEIFAE